MLLWLQDLDFETKSSYMLRVEASNPYVDARFLSSGPFSDVVPVRLLVQNVDEPPVFHSAVSWMVVSEAASVGTEVGSVLARDPDATNSPLRYFCCSCSTPDTCWCSKGPGSSCRYSLDSGSNLERYFHVDSGTGVITTAQPLDRETVAVHNITVVATQRRESEAPVLGS